MDMELDEIFRWQTPLGSLLADIGGIAEDGIDGMLDQIEVPELLDDIIGGGAVATNLSSTEEPVSSPLWPCDLHTNSNVSVLRLPPVQLSAAATKLPAASLQDPVGLSQSSSAPQVTGEAQGEAPAAAKPKRARASKSTPKTKKPCPGVAEQPVKEKENRLPTQAEHIIRERQRRDDMATKYSILESLLPPAPKRERGVVVESAILFMKELQQKRTELLNRRAQLKLMAPVQSKKTAPLHDPSGFVTDSGCKEPQAAENCRTDSPISSTQQQTLITSPGTTNPSAAVEDPKSVQQLHIHVQFSDEEIFIEMVCHQPRHDIQSFLLHGVESLGLDVVRCTIHRVPHGFVQCTITCSKAQVLNASLASLEVLTSATLVGALKNVFTRS